MTSNSNHQNPQKTVIHQDLKFSVEFENGETSDRRIANTTYERTTSKDIELDNFKDNNGKSEHVATVNAISKSKPRNNQHVGDEDTDLTPGVKKARTEERTDKRNATRTTRTEHERTTRTTVRTDVTHGSETVTTVTEGQKRVHRTSVDSLRGTKHKPLPAIGRTEAGGGKQRWEKPGDPGEIPIQARIRGPGPANYLLPSTIGRRSVDMTRRHSPAFSFGSRSWTFRNESPGPAYNFDPLMGSKGKENRPSFSFGTKPKTPVRRFISPGPGSYNTDSPPLWEKRAPQYSISPRTKQRPMDVVPGPNTYLLPTTLGDRVPNQRGAPAITMAGHSKVNGYAEDLAKTPGPARYGTSHVNVTQRKSPEYSVQGRSFYTGNKNITPGPGAYNPQDVNSHLEQSPRHVIGVKHSEFVMPTLTIADCD